MNAQRIFIAGSIVAALLLSACGGDKKKPKVNHAPTAQSASFTTQADTELKGTLMATDADGDSLTFAVANQPAQGTLVLNANGSFVYTPNADTIGADEFTFTVTDGKSTTAASKASITIDKLDVAFDAYSRKAFAQEASANPLPLNTRNVQQNVTDPAAYDDLLK